MKKLLSRIMVIALILATIICSVVPASAASVKMKSEYNSYTITTGNSNCTLSLTPSRGTRAQKYVNIKTSKTKVCTNNTYAAFTVTVNGKKYNVGTKTVKVSLNKNTTYTVTISRGNPCEIYAKSMPIGLDFYNWRTSGSEYWKSAPSVKLDTGWFGPKIR